MPPRTHPDTEKAIAAYCSGNKSCYATAKEFGIDPSTLYKALKKLGLLRTNM